MYRYVEAFCCVAWLLYEVCCLLYENKASKRGRRVELLRRRSPRVHPAAAICAFCLKTEWCVGLVLPPFVWVRPTQFVAKLYSRYSVFYFIGSRVGRT